MRSIGCHTHPGRGGAACERVRSDPDHHDAARPHGRRRGRATGWPRDPWRQAAAGGGGRECGRSSDRDGHGHRWACRGRCDGRGGHGLHRHLLPGLRRRAERTGRSDVCGDRGVKPSGRREPVVTIDGPAGAGKSTVARDLARRLGLGLVSTGALYRALAWAVREAHVDIQDVDALQRTLDRTDVSLTGERVLVDGRDVTDWIRTPEISELTSVLTKQRAVRDKMTPLQRDLAARGGVVLEGRDTGSVVWPEAEVKFYLDADLETRAGRPQSDLRAQGVDIELAAVQADVAR